MTPTSDLSEVASHRSACLRKVQVHPRATAEHALGHRTLER